MNVCSKDSKCKKKGQNQSNSKNSNAFPLVHVALNCSVEKTEFKATKSR